MKNGTAGSLRSSIVLVWLLCLSCADNSYVSSIDYRSGFYRWSKPDEIIFTIRKETLINHPGQDIFSSTQSTTYENYGISFLNLTKKTLLVRSDTLVNPDSADPSYAHDTVFSFDSSYAITYYPSGTIDSFIVLFHPTLKPICTVPAFVHSQPSFVAYWDSL